MPHRKGVQHFFDFGPRRAFGDGVDCCSADGTSHDGQPRGQGFDNRFAVAVEREGQVVHVLFRSRRGCEGLPKAG